MNGAEVRQIAQAVRRVYEIAGWSPPLPSARREGPAVGPVPLDRFISAFSLVYDEVPGLTRALAGAYLLRWGVKQPALLQDPSPLAGFLFANSRGGYILVRQDDPLPRRRFSAAHELGHFLLHFREGRRGEGGALVIDDEPQVLREDEVEVAGAAAARRERQANRFAAELLMPEVTCRALHAHYRSCCGRTPRFLESRTAGDLLVSRQAMRCRLRSLGLDGAGDVSLGRPGAKGGSP